MIRKELSRDIIGAAMEVRTTHNLAKSRRRLPALVMSSEKKLALSEAEWVETSPDSDC